MAAKDGFPSSMRAATFRSCQKLDMMFPFAVPMTAPSRPSCLSENAPRRAELPGQQILCVEFLKREPLGFGRGLSGGEYLREALIEVRGKLLDNFGFPRAAEVKLHQARANGGLPIRHIPLP